MLGSHTNNEGHIVNLLTFTFWSVENTVEMSYFRADSNLYLIRPRRKLIQ